jgi:hypothetical protein
MNNAFWGEPTNAAFILQGIKDILLPALSALLIQLTSIEN